MKTTSRFALAAAAGLLLGAAMTPANAADLGGGCCADLEERVAELEATTARKGNRVVSLQVYGQVNKGLLIWDDGVDSDAFVVDNIQSSSRFGFVGKAKIKPGWTAGYNIEFEIIDARSNKITQGKAGDDAADGTTGDHTLSLRHNNFYIESERLGRITVGQQSTAADGAISVNLSNALSTSDTHLGASLSIRDSVGPANDGVLKNWANDLGASRDDVIRYDSPSIYGFIASASWGDNDFADVALRFKKEFNSIRVAAAIGYIWDNTATGSEFEEVAGSISVMHVPTGLYMSFAAASRDYEAASASDPNYWYLQAGIERKFLPYGATTVYGEYAKYSDFINTNSEAVRWGLGLNQRIDSAAMDIYAQAQFWSFDRNQPGYDDQLDLTTVIIGSRIKF